MKRLLVTGASGLLGLNLILQTNDRYEIVGVMRRERLVEGAAQKPALFEPLYMDLVEEAAAGKPGADRIGRLLDEAKPDGIIHCAAMTDVDYCEGHPEEASLINTWISGVLAREAFRRRTPMLHVSTDAVFDGLRDGDCLYSEEDDPHPLNVYGQTKLAGERQVAEAHPDAIIARVNFYGWSWQGSRSLAEWFYNNLSKGVKVRGFTNLTFCPLLVNQMVEILLRMMALNLSGVYHVVSSECISKYAFGMKLARRFGFDEDLISPHSFQMGDLKALRSLRLAMRSDKLQQALTLGGGGSEAEGGSEAGARLADTNRSNLPGQAEGLDRFYELYQQGYPNALRSILTKRFP